MVSSRISNLLILSTILSSLYTLPVESFSKGEVAKVVASHAGPVNNRK